MTCEVADPPGTWDQWTSIAIIVAVGTVLVVIAKTFGGVPNLLPFSATTCAISNLPGKQTRSAFDL